MAEARPGSPRSRYPEWPDSLDIKLPEHKLIQGTVINLRRQKTRLGSVKAVAEKTGVPASTISDILNGNTWPTLETMARLEIGLTTPLWPGVGKLKKSQ